MYLRVKDDLKSLNIKVYEYDTKNRKESRFQYDSEYKQIINIETGETYQSINEIKDIKSFERECLKIKIDYSESSETQKKLTNQARSMTRTKSRLIDIVNYNFNYWQEQGTGNQTKFITLTFKENITSHAIANREFKKFIQRLRYTYGQDFSYVSVIEYQKRGAIHYHCIFFNLPYIHYTEFNKIWGQGFTDLQSLEKIGNVGFYITKCLDYMLEDMDKKQEGQKFYLQSRNILKIKEEYSYISDSDYVALMKLAEQQDCKIYEYSTLQKIKMFNIKKSEFKGE